MERHIEECINTVTQIITKTKEKNPKLPVRFAIVGYRDHPMRNSKILKALLDTANNRKRELLQIIATHKLSQVVIS